MAGSARPGRFLIPEIVYVQRQYGGTRLGTCDKIDRGLYGCNLCVNAAILTHYADAHPDWQVDPAQLDTICTARIGQPGGYLNGCDGYGGILHDLHPEIVYEGRQSYGNSPADLNQLAMDKDQQKVIELDGIFLGLGFPTHYMRLASWDGNSLRAGNPWTGQVESYDANWARRAITGIETYRLPGFGGGGAQPAMDKIAGLDSSTFRPSRDTALAAKAGGVGLWGGYLATKPGVGLYSPWDLASFDAVRILPGKPIAYCSGWDDPVACASLARAWDVRLCLDVEGGGLRGDGDWVQGFIDAAGRDFCGLYGNYGIFAGRVAAFYVVGGYPGYDPAQTWGYVARPSGPCGWQWRGSADEYGGSVDRGTYDGWFTQGASTAPEEESMSYVIQGDQKSTCWVTDEISRRYIGDLGELERLLKRTKRPLEKVPQFDIDRIPVSFRVPEDLTGTGLTSYDDVVFGPRRQAAPVSAGTASIRLQEATPPAAEWAPSPEEVQKLHSKLGFYPVVGADHKA